MTKPLILSLHDATEPALRELREEEFEAVTGGCTLGEVPTVTSTPDADGGPDGTDCLDDYLNYGP